MLLMYLLLHECWTLLPGYQSFSFQRVACGGSDGIYYTSSVGKRTGGDGVSGLSS